MRAVCWTFSRAERRRQPCTWSQHVVALCLLLAGEVGGLATKSTTVAVDVDVDVDVEVEVEVDRPGRVVAAKKEERPHGSKKDSARQVSVPVVMMWLRPVEARVTRESGVFGRPLFGFAGILPLLFQDFEISRLISHVLSLDFNPPGISRSK